MRRYTNCIIILSALGVFLSGILLFQHYFPEIELGLISCGKGLINECMTVNQSKFSTIFGIPLAAYGIAYYLTITLLMLIADYAKDEYYKKFMVITALLVSAGLIADIFLASILIYIGALCHLCIGTYGINLAIFFIVFVYIKKYTDINVIKKIVTTIIKPQSSDEKAQVAFMIIFLFFLAFSIFAANNILKIKSNQEAIPEKHLTKMVDDFYKQKPEDINFPKSNLIIGNKNAPVKIYTFTDFLCSACYRFYKIEKFILSKYKNKVQIIYYHYPLDSKCNKYMDDSVYKNSCIASKAMEVIGKHDLFPEYFYTHFSRYPKYKSGYDDRVALKNMEITIKNSKISAKNREKILNQFKNIDTTYKETIKRDIDFAEKYKIEATPTFYIGGRKFIGSPRKEMLERLIENEISKSKF